MAWGEGNLPGRRPPWEIRSPRAGAPQEAYIKGGRGGGQCTHCPGASLSLSNTSPSSIEHGEALPEYCSSTITTPSCCCWSLLPQPLLCLAGSRRRRRHAFRTCVERGGAVRSALDHR